MSEAYESKFITIIKALSVAFITFATTLAYTITGVHWTFSMIVFIALYAMWVWGYYIGKSAALPETRLLLKEEREYIKRLEESLIVANKAYDKEFNRAEEAEEYITQLKVTIESFTNYSKLDGGE